MRTGTFSKSGFIATVLAALALAATNVAAAPPTPVQAPRLTATSHEAPVVPVEHTTPPVVHPTHVETTPAVHTTTPATVKVPRVQPVHTEAAPHGPEVQPVLQQHVPSTITLNRVKREPPTATTTKSTPPKAVIRVVPPQVEKVRLFEENVPDPHISVAPDGRFRFVATSGRAGWTGAFPPDPGDEPIFEIRQSVAPGDLKQWQPVSHVFEKGQRPEWTKKAPRNPGDPASVEEAKQSQRGDFWAPELHTVGKKSVLYFTARDQKTGELSIGVAHTDDPKLGNWKSPPKPLVELHELGVIDPTFYEENGENFLVYKTDGNDPKRMAPTEFFVQKLSADGTAVAKGPNGAPVAPIRILRNDPASWEGINIEAPSVMKIGGWVYLIYSGNMFNTPNYAVGVARARSLSTPIDQWEKFGSPIITNDKGPGHGAPFLAGDKLKYVFHQWRGGVPLEQDIREVYTTDLKVGADGWLHAVPPTPGAPSMTGMTAMTAAH